MAEYWAVPDCDQDGKPLWRIECRLKNGIILCKALVDNLAAAEIATKHLMGEEYRLLGQPHDPFPTQDAFGRYDYHTINGD